MTPEPGRGLTCSRNQHFRSRPALPSSRPWALVLSDSSLRGPPGPGRRRLPPACSSRHQGVSIRFFSEGPALSSELGARRDPLWPVLCIFSISGHREVRSKTTSFLVLIGSDCVPTGAGTPAFHRRFFRRAVSGPDLPALRSPGDGATDSRCAQRQHDPGPGPRP